MANPDQINLMYDERLASYRTMFNHNWAKQVFQLVDGTKLDPPFFELVTNWRAAVNTHCFPWMMVNSLAALWEGISRDHGLTSVFVRQMASEISHRMQGKITNVARKKLTDVVRDFADDIQRKWKDSPEAKVSADEIWQAFLSDQTWEFRVAIWGSQRFCFGAIYHAYESYFREVLAVKKRNPNYRFFRFDQLLTDTTSEFGQPVADTCLTGDIIDISRFVRNALAHQGGKENKDLVEYGKTKDHGIPVESGFLQIMAPHNKSLITALESRITLLTQEALKYPEFQ